TTVRELDESLGNFLFLASAMVLTIAFITISLRRVRPWRYAFAPLGLVLVAGIGFFSVYRFKEFDGEMWPQFTQRFAPNTRVLPVESVAANGDVDPSKLPRDLADDAAPQSSLSTTGKSYPGFLGPQRNGAIAEREFAIDWDFNPPQLLWKQPIGEGWAGFAMAGDYAVTLEQREEEEWLSCYNATTGELVWHVAHPGRHEDMAGGIGPRSTPTIEEDRVYAQSATGKLWCVNIADGSVVWEHNLIDEQKETVQQFEGQVQWGRAGSPLILDELCIVPSGELHAGQSSNDPNAKRFSLIALNKLNGEIIWKGGESQISYASPIHSTIAGVPQIVSMNESDVTGHDPQTGNVLWRFPFFGDSNGPASCTTPITIDDDKLLISKAYGTGYILLQFQQQDDGTLTAKPIQDSARYLKTKFSHVAVKGDDAFAINDGTMVSVNYRTAKLNWRQPRRGRFGHGQSIRVEDVLLVISEEGDVVLMDLNPNEYTEIARMSALDDKTWNMPALAGTLLIVRNHQSAAAYRLPNRNE
ncbi:MAG: PQQ-binding-like beta-propeller repeat protein, partial [Planctomycetota bacterium]